jgi:hypothetical protein
LRIEKWIRKAQTTRGEKKRENQNLNIFNKTKKKKRKREKQTLPAEIREQR